MKSTVVKASLRNDAGRKISNSLRRQGLVPAIVYGGEEQVLVQIDERQFKNIVYTPNVYLIDLDVEGTTYKTILQDIQFHPVTDKITHADFLLISEDKPVIISIPVNSVGTSKGVVAGGKLNINRRKLKVKFLRSHHDSVFFEPNLSIISAINLGKHGNIVKSHEKSTWQIS